MLVAARKDNRDRQWTGQVSFVERQRAAGRCNAV